MEWGWIDWGCRDDNHIKLNKLALYRITNSQSTRQCRQTTTQQMNATIRATSTLLCVILSRLLVFDAVNNFEQRQRALRLLLFY